MKLTKIQVHFEHPAKGMDHCKDCKHFISPDSCKIVEGVIRPNDWCERFEEKDMVKKKHAGHGFKHTHIEHHHDGSHTVHHMHEDGSEHDVKHAAPHHDAMIDSLMEHTSAPNPGEAQADMGDHGVPPAVAGPAGLPGMGA